MPTLDLEHGFTPGLGPPDEVVIAFFRAFLPDFYFVNTPISRMRHHLKLIRALPTSPLIIHFYRPAGAHFTELTLCAGDDAQPGLLSKVAGTLAALNISVHTAWIHTLRDPHDIESGRRVVLDTLILSEKQSGMPRPLTEKTQTRVRETLTPILGGHTGVAQLFSKNGRRPSGLAIDEIFAAPAREGMCQITLRARDEATLLFRVTGALARLKLDIAHAQINTFETSVADVFFVGKTDGAAIGTEEIPGLLDQLRRELQEAFGAEIPSGR